LKTVHILSSKCTLQGANSVNIQVMYWTIWPDLPLIFSTGTLMERVKTPQFLVHTL